MKIEAKVQGDVAAKRVTGRPSMVGHAAANGRHPRSMTRPTEALQSIHSILFHRK